MRAKHILNRLPFGSKIRLVYDRITLTPFTTTFVFVALGHCFVQISLQAAAFASNTEASETVADIIGQSGMPRRFAFVKKGVLRLCNGIPLDADMDSGPCWAFAGPGVSQPGSNLSVDVAVRLSARPHYGLAYSPARGVASRDVTAVPDRDGSGDVVGVDVTGLDSDPDEVTELSTRCVNALNWPDIILYDARREDISFLVFQIWLLGISIVTILNESIPHLIAALVTHALSSAWSAFQVSRTDHYQFEYSTLVVNDACNGINVIPNFWSDRINYFIPILSLNLGAFVITLIISYRLFSVYARQSFLRVGACKMMNRRYLFVLLFSVFLQLSAFFTICASALWVDSLCNGALVQFAVHRTAYRVVFIITGVIELPWIIIGWNAIRREHRLWSIIFLVVGVVLTAAWSSMFANVLYRWTFENSPFFATVTITAFIVLIITLALALVCRGNFGKGLPQSLKTEENTFDESSFIPVILPNKHESRLVSVVFPDKRTSTAARATRASEIKEKTSFGNGYNPYKRPASDGSIRIIDIKAPDSDSDSDSDSASQTSNKSGTTTAADAPRDSLPARARAPFLRLSDTSRLGKFTLGLRFSVFTTSSGSADLERGVPEAALPIPAVPGSRAAEMSRMPAVPTPVVAAPARSVLHERRASRSAPLPIINVISASVPRAPALSAEQGDLFPKAASEDSGSLRSVNLRSEGRQSMSSVRSGRVGLPTNPRSLLEQR